MWEICLHVWWQDKKESDNCLINKDRFDKQHITIKDYYFTTKGRLVPWVKLDPVMVNEIHRRAIKASSKNFRTTNFIPNVARDRKLCIDKILIAFKRDHEDFQYTIRNGKDDIQVLVKWLSEFHHAPYRRIPIENFGAISPSKTTFKPEKSPRR